MSVKKPALTLFSLALTSTLLVSPSFAATAAAAPTQSDPATACAEAVDDLVESEGVDGQREINYSCTSSGIVVQDAEGDTVAEEQVEESSDVYKAFTSSEPTECGITTEPERTILNRLQVNIQACVIYGQNNSPINGTWESSTNVLVEFYPHFTTYEHRITIRPETFDRTTVSGRTQAYQHRGILPPEKYYATWGWWVTSGDPDFGSATFTAVLLLPDEELYDGIYSVKFENITVRVAEKSFSVPIQGDWDTPRFFCEAEEELCYFPNGEEAPIFG